MFIKRIIGMKISVFATILIVTLGFAISSYAQVQHTSMDLNGYIFKDAQTRDSLVTKFGEPDNYRSITTEFGKDEEYRFGQNAIRLTNNGIFNCFILNDNRFAIYTFAINGGIRVGDSVNKFLQLGFGTLQFVNAELYNFSYLSDFPLDIHHVNGIITSLQYCSSTI